MLMKCLKCLTDFGASDVIAKSVECKKKYHPLCTWLGSSNISKNKLKQEKCNTCQDESNLTASIKSNDELYIIFYRKSY